MDIVIDTSAIIAVITNEPTKPELIKITSGAQLFAPRSIHWEIGNAFSAMLKRNRLTLAQAQKAVTADAYLIACAQKKKSALLTLDKGLKHAAKRVAVTVLEVNP